MVFLLFVTPMVGTIQLLVETAFPDVTYEFVANLITVVASPVITFATLLLLYKHLPNTEVSFKDVWMGALVASLAIDGATWGFIWYVNTFPTYNVVYGPDRCDHGTAELGLRLGNNPVVRGAGHLAGMHSMWTSWAVKCAVSDSCGQESRESE